MSLSLSQNESRLGTNSANAESEYKDNSKMLKSGAEYINYNLTCHNDEVCYETSVISSSFIDQCC